jgi:hypothetical protein
MGLTKKFVGWDDFRGERKCRWRGVKQDEATQEGETVQWVKGRWGFRERRDKRDLLQRIPNSAIFFLGQRQSVRKV